MSSTSTTLRLSLLSASLLVGCGAGAGASAGRLAPKEPFPTREALAEIATAPPKAMPKRDVSFVRDWTVDPRDATSSVEAHLAEITGADSGLQPTPELRCVARELARFYVKQHAMPDERLRHFVMLACGVHTRAVETVWLSGDAPDAMKEDKLLAELRGKLPIPAAARGKPAGAWLARGGGKAVVMITVETRRDADLTIEPADAQGRVRVSGEVHVQAENVFALVNQADRGVARCDVDASIALPRFAFVCAMAEEDKTARLEVSVQLPGRVLTRPVGVGVARRDPNDPIDYRASARQAQTVASAGDLRGAVLAGVNAARTSAGLAPLVLASKQTAVNERLATHFFSAELGGDDNLSEKIALGLLAGWEIGGTIRSGGFYSALESGSTDALSWLDYALESPSGRYALLDPAARQIAIGAGSPGDLGGVGAVVTTYAFFGEPKAGDEGKAVLKRLAALRAASHLTPPAPIAGLEHLTANTRLVGEGRMEPMEALERSLSQESTRHGRTLRGWVVVTHDLDTMQVPSELLAPGNLVVGVDVAHWRAEGAAWGSYVVFLLVPADAPQNVASAK
jgi:hypothetical protein